MLNTVFRSFTFLGALTVVAGCGEVLPITEPAAIPKFANSFDQKRLHGEGGLSVRTYVPNPDRPSPVPNVEIAGAACLAKSQEFSVRFRTPAILAVPAIIRQPTPLSVTCELDARKGALRLNPRRQKKSSSKLG